MLTKKKSLKFPIVLSFVIIDKMFIITWIRIKIVMSLNENKFKMTNIRVVIWMNVK